jgi:hypothetical protein
MLGMAQVTCCFGWGKGSIFPVNQKPLSGQRGPTDIAMKYWRISVECLTRALVNEVEGNRDYLESFERHNYSISNITGWLGGLEIDV